MSVKRYKLTFLFRFGQWYFRIGTWRYNPLKNCQIIVRRDWQDKARETVFIALLYKSGGTEKDFFYSSHGIEIRKANRAYIRDRLSAPYRTPRKWRDRIFRVTGIERISPWQYPHRRIQTVIRNWIAKGIRNIGRTVQKGTNFLACKIEVKVHWQYRR